MMDPNELNQSPEMRILNSVHEGMEVFDREGKHVGKVEYIHMGADRNDVSGAGAADYAHIPDRRDNFLTDIARAFEADDRLPDTVKNRLLYDGFARMDSSVLFHGDRYILPDQIDHVEGDRVILNVTYDNLTHRSELTDTP